MLLRQWDLYIFINDIVNLLTEDSNETLKKDKKNLI